MSDMERIRKQEAKLQELIQEYHSKIEDRKKTERLESDMEDLRRELDEKKLALVKKDAEIEDVKKETEKTVKEAERKVLVKDKEVTALHNELSEHKKLIERLRKDLEDEKIRTEMAGRAHPSMTELVEIQRGKKTRLRASRRG